MYGKLVKHFPGGFSDSSQKYFLINYIMGEVTKNVFAEILLSSAAEQQLIFKKSSFFSLNENWLLFICILKYLSTLAIIHYLYPFPATFAEKTFSKNQLIQL